MRRGALVAIGFLTRFPVRMGPLDEREVGRSLPYFPVAGLALGLPLVAIALFGQALLGPTATALAVVAALAWLSAGLHLDGLADLFDGLGGGRGDRDRILAIMRDSRIGSHGAAALALVLVGKVIATGDLLRDGALLPLLALPVIGRAVMVPLVVFHPYAREGGLGRAFKDHGRLGDVAIAGAVAGLVALGTGTVVPAVTAVAAALVLGAVARRRLGGLTGDVYGAAAEVAELVFLCMA